MNGNFQKDRILIYLAFLGALLIISFVIYLNHRADQQHLANTRLVIHTHKVLAESEFLFSTVKDAQRGQRGYLLTQEEEYLLPYYEAKKFIQQSLRNLQLLTNDDDVQQRRLVEIRKYINKTLTYWDTTIQINKDIGSFAAVSRVRSGKGKELVELIEQSVNHFQGLEEERLQQRQASFEKSKFNSQVSQLIGWLSSLFLLLFSFLLLHTRLRREEELSETLEKKVQMRTEQLQASNAELQSSLEELHNKNQELQRTNVDLDNFVYTASHDLRSPINNLDGFIKVLTSRLEGKTDKTEQEILAFMKDSVVRLNRTIGTLAEVARIRKEDQVKEDVFFEQVLGDVSSDIAPIIRETGTQIITSFGVEHLHYPYNHLRSIIYNLVSNAIKYRAPERPPVIKIETLQEKGGIGLIVSDNGLGLDENQLEKIFIMFKRLHTHVEGTGVGLYIVKRIIENNGGVIKVMSQKGVGTSFRIFFNTTPAENHQQQKHISTPG
jgi:signal transduction histidine kinase